MPGWLGLATMTCRSGLAAGAGHRPGARRPRSAPRRRLPHPRRGAADRPGRARSSGARPGRGGVTGTHHSVKPGAPRNLAISVQDSPPSRERKRPAGSVTAYSVEGSPGAAATSQTSRSPMPLGCHERPASAERKSPTVERATQWPFTRDRCRTLGPSSAAADVPLAASTTKMPSPVPTIAVLMLHLRGRPRVRNEWSDDRPGRDRRQGTRADYPVPSGPVGITGESAARLKLRVPKRVRVTESMSQSTSRAFYRAGLRRR